MFGSGDIIFALLLVVAQMVDGLPQLRRDVYHADEVPIAERVSYAIVVLTALPGLVWCLGEWAILTELNAVSWRCCKAIQSQILLERIVALTLRFALY